MDYEWTVSKRPRSRSRYIHIYTSQHLGTRRTVIVCIHIYLCLSSQHSPTRRSSVAKQDIYLPRLGGWPATPSSNSRSPDCRQQSAASSQTMHTCMYTCMYTYMYMYTYVYIYIYIYMYMYVVFDLFVVALQTVVSYGVYH